MFTEGESMRKYCSDCAYLNIEKAKCNGIYQCNSKKFFTCACSEACEKFKHSYHRNSFEKQKLYDLGKKVEQNSDISVVPYLLLMILLELLFIFAKIQGY